MYLCILLFFFPRRVLLIFFCCLESKVISSFWQVSQDTVKFDKNLQECLKFPYCHTCFLTIFFSEKAILNNSKLFLINFFPFKFFFKLFSHVTLFWMRAFMSIWLMGLIQNFTPNPWPWMEGKMNLTFCRKLLLIVIWLFQKGSNHGCMVNIPGWLQKL